ncbi:PucR family transcriptional regulator [Leucobacter sp. NPDC015123]|uniref:PucR family transcriptional regulator n=1 Tax=Leucobacter sp. NPDC015123 TaxID=3364129 RepID=UPI0036F463F2
MPRSLTVRELAVRLGTPVTLNGPVDTRVDSVRVVDNHADILSVAAGCALVLTGDATREAWRLERGIRLAWERAVSCVVISAADVTGPEPAELAARLGVALITLDTGVLDATVRFAAIIATDEASEAGTLAEAARAFGVAKMSPRRALATLHRLLPDHEFALTDHAGAHVAGEQRVSEAGSHELHVRVPFPDPRFQARLVGRPRRGPGERDASNATAATVARLAIAPLTSWAALRHIAFGRDVSRAETLLAGVMAADGAPSEKLRGGLAAGGWPLGSRYRAAKLLASGGRSAALDELVLARVSELATQAFASPHGDGWAVFFAVPLTGEQKVAQATIAQLVAADPRVARIAVGVSTACESTEPPEPALAEADRAAYIAQSTPSLVMFSEGLTPEAALPALLGADAEVAARALLKPLLEVDRDGALLKTLVVSLDHNDRPAQVAQVLGVHRNTVTARLERVRGLGIDPSNPGHRLAIHIAARRVLDE